MKMTKLLLIASTVALTPVAVLAAPGGHGAGMGHGGMSQPTVTQSSQGPTSGTGWSHLNEPAHTTGQPGFECEEIRPGHASTAPGSAFNEEGKAGTRYAGEQPQNSRNTASVSQYDTACLHQPQH